MRVCIVGTGRCGTTLLWNMLNSHPDLFVFRETHWIPYLFDAFGMQKVPVRKQVEIVARTKFVTGEQVTEFDCEAFLDSGLVAPRCTVPEFCEALAKYLARPEYPRYWGDKTPDYGHFLGRLMEYWPNCKIIHIIRDGVDVSVSMSRHPGYRALAQLDIPHWGLHALDFEPPSSPFSTQPIEKFIELWFRRLERIRDEAKRIPQNNFMEVRHETLIGEPLYTLLNICEFIDIDPKKSWLEEAEQIVERGRGGRYPDATKILRLFSEEQRALMRELGYDTR